MEFKPVASPKGAATGPARSKAARAPGRGAGDRAYGEPTTPA
jgi:hypothetical protein